jgi:DNA modification methylase
VRTPKLSSAKSTRDASWYRYYAGYSPDFVTDALQEVHSDSKAVVLDPWNGSGTTTTVAYDSNRPSAGFDINPALVLVAKSRILGPEVVESLDALTAEVLAQAAVEMKNGLAIENEPLALWFSPRLARYLRCVERVVYRLTVDAHSSALVAELEGLSGVSSLSSYFYVLVFDVVRQLVAPFASSNPTWTRPPGADDDRIDIGRTVIKRRIWATQARLKKLIAVRPHDGNGLMPTLELASSTALPLADKSVGCVISSPPYCTRIDYAMATRPELAVLGSSASSIRSLRHSMIGTPTVRQTKDLQAKAEWGVGVNAFLQKVSGHPSKASATYYAKYFMGYYRAMYESLAELRRVVTPGGRCLLVVQDSYYKDIHNDLAANLIEMSEALGWSKATSGDFNVPRTMAQVNPGARKYRTRFDATETVLCLA